MQLQVREEQQLQEQRNRQALEAAQQLAREKEKDRQSVIHELVREHLGAVQMWHVSCRPVQMVSERPATEVLASHTAQSVGPAASTIKRDLTQPTFQGSAVVIYM